MSTDALEIPLSGAPVAPVSERARGLERFQKPLLALLLAVFFLVGWQGREPTMRAAGEDEFVYLALSKSLETGSYREVFRPTAPLHVQYPPAYPAWLTLMRKVLGENLDRIRMANLAMAATALLLMFAVMRRLAGPEPALALLLLLVLNPVLLRMGGAIVSENLFLLVVTLALVWTLSADATGRPAAVLPIAFALLAFLTRSIGLAAVAGVGCWLWSRRRWGALVGWGIASVLVVGAWFSYTILAGDSTVRSYSSDFAAVSAATGGTLLHLARRVGSHGLEYATSGIPGSLSLPTIPGTLVDNWFWLAISVILLLTGWLVLWRRWRAAAVYVLMYLGILLIWPYTDDRLLAPLVPLALLAFLLGALGVARALPARGRRPALVGLIALLTFGAGRGALERLRLYRDCDRSNPLVSRACYKDETLAMVAAAGYLREHAAPGDIVLSASPASMNYLSGHPIEVLSLLVGLPAESASDTLRARRIHFVVVPVPWAARALLPTCGHYQVSAEYLPFALLLSTAEPSGSPDACSALRKFAAAPPPGSG
jgi:4-amino-4-deoxy-L-arabinose transferase-like glycosyltransferase